MSRVIRTYKPREPKTWEELKVLACKNFLRRRRWPSQSYLATEKARARLITEIRALEASPLERVRHINLYAAGVKDYFNDGDLFRWLIGISPRFSEPRGQI